MAKPRKFRTARPRKAAAGKPPQAVQEQVSAGGVTFRRDKHGVKVALISVSDPPRWQLPKGHVDTEETAEQAALREVREEAGIDAEMLEPIETIDYWFYVPRGTKKVRLHKFVHFYLMSYQAGDVRHHDEEVNEARWFDIDEAIDALTFKTERKVLEKAREMIEK